MSVRVRFAPSPTGKVHIGNIRAAIFNYLFARHNDGKFLVRVEDTDIERSTTESIDALFDVMNWLELDFDEDPLYQTSQADKHLEAAKKLQEQGDAYYHAKGDGGEALIYRIPWYCDDMDGVKTVGEQTMTIHPDVPVKIDYTGISYAAVSKKGKAVPQEACLAGFKNLKVFGAEEGDLFTLNDKIDEVLAGDKEFVIENPVRLEFTRRSIGYTDLVKGELSKPLDSMKDQVIVRSNGTPIFHLSNVCDDVTQGISHIVRGDDHVENTYRHLFLFQSLGAETPQYAHLPMIVNQSGKPYSKRDGDAFVGDFREKGFQAAALFNYLTLLGWNPGDEREKMTKEELIEAFSLDRVKSAPAQMDIKKLTSLNASCLAEMEITAFIAEVTRTLEGQEWFAGVDSQYLKKVAQLMQPRTSLFSDSMGWNYFFTENFEYDAKAYKKNVTKGDNIANLKALAANIEALEELTEQSLEATVVKTVAELEVGEFKLHQPLRMVMTGVTSGAGVFEIAALLGKAEVLKRIASVS